MKRSRRTPLIGVVLAVICVCPSWSTAASLSSSTSTRSNSTSTSLQQSHAADYIANGIGLTALSSSSSLGSTSSSSSSSVTSTSSTSSISSSSSTASSNGPKFDNFVASSRTSSSTSTTSPASTKQSSSSSTSQTSKTNNSSVSLASTGSGFAYASACNQALYTWSKSWMTFPTSLCTSDPTMTAPKGAGVPSNDATTLCDGIPRMVGNFSTFPGEARRHCSNSQTITGAPPRPSCSIQPNDCKGLMTSFSQAHAIPNNVNLVLHSYVTSRWSDYPRCVTYTDTCTNSGTVVPNAGCAIYGGGIQLLYWPQTWASGFCGEHNRAVTMGPTIAGKPNTAVHNGVTLTSPTVYIKYDALSASNRCLDPIGPTLTSGLVPIASGDVSTKRPWFWTNMPWEGPSGLMHVARSVGIQDAATKGWPGLDPDYADQIYPLDYPDLDDPVPGAPYFAQRIKAMDLQCWSGGCPTMIPSENFPVLAIPSDVVALAPEWASCTLPWGAMNDPPIALAPVASMDGVSLPPGQSSTSSAPQNTITSPSVQKTSAPATPCITPTVATPASTGSANANTGALSDSLPSPPASNPSPNNNPSPGNSPSPPGNNPSPSLGNNPSPLPGNNPSPSPSNGPSPSPGNDSASSGPAANPRPSGNTPSPSDPDASHKDSGVDYAYSPQSTPPGQGSFPPPQTFAFSNAVANINIGGGSTLTASMISTPGSSAVAIMGTNTLSNNGPAVTVNSQLYRLVNGQIEGSGGNAVTGSNANPQGSSASGSNTQQIGAGGSSPPSSGGAVAAAGAPGSGTSQQNSSSASSNLASNGQGITNDGTSYRSSILHSALGVSIVALGFMFL